MIKFHVNCYGKKDLNLLKKREYDPFCIGSKGVLDVKKIPI
jgi:hypothetical protein